MRALLIGGTGFIGSYLTPALQRLGADVAMLTRGRSGNAGSAGLTRIVGDRRQLRDSEAAIRAFAPDVVIDLILSSGTQARELVSVLRGIAGRVVALSSMDVYRACGLLHGLEQGPLEPVPLTEQSALRTKLATYPPAQIAMVQQVYGWVDAEYDKIPVERAILEDGERPATILRLPMIYGSLLPSRSRPCRTKQWGAFTTSRSSRPTRSSSGPGGSRRQRGGRARSSFSRRTRCHRTSGCLATSINTGPPTRPASGRSSATWRRWVSIPPSRKRSPGSERIPQRSRSRRSITPRRMRRSG
jgi:hypothetical protein